MIELVGTIALVLTLFVYSGQLRTMNAQRRAMEREIASRMRPWVGMFHLELDSESPSNGAKEHRLRILLKNFGAVPAQRARLGLIAKAADGMSALPLLQEAGLKALMPGEEGNYRFALGAHPEYVGWAERRAEVEIEGEMTYALGEAEYRTEFEITINFSGPDQQPNVKWRNCEAL